MPVLRGVPDSPAAPCAWRSKMRCGSIPEIPLPVSVTVRRAVPPWRSVVTVTVPPDGVYFVAFSISPVRIRRTATSVSGTGIGSFAGRWCR